MGDIYLQPHLNGLKPDFVLLNPYVGLAVFEVKDWNLDALKYFTQKNDRDEWELWAQDNALKRFRIRNPIEQVEYYRREILNSKPSPCSEKWVPSYNRRSNFSLCTQR